MKRKIFFITMAVLATLFIWSHSMQTADSSTTESDRVVEIVGDVLEAVGKETPRKNLVKPVRKSAHFFEFIVQGLFIAAALMPDKKKYAYLLFLGFITACTDECIQLFFDGRAGMISDVFIDFSGTLTAAAVSLIYQRIRRRI